MQLNYRSTLMGKGLLASCLSLLCVSFAQAQTTSTEITNKTLPAVRTNKKLTIDGVLNDSAWLAAPVATNFVEFRPAFGNVEDPKNKTEIYILYDDDAIYIGGFCHEPSTDSISKELVGRDVIGVNDFVGVLFDTYKDKINGFGYYITPLGEQYDAKYTNNGEDGSWNSVYESKANIVAGGWTFEMRIPYAAIRFSNNKIQDWGINITRNRKKSGKQYFWYPVNPNVGGTLFSQAGVWTNIQNIKPPLRLSLSPYLATYANHNGLTDPKTWTTTINGGMDVKYGINAAFTLDMTLIPDFGQVQSDNQVLNLSPFEVKFNENRTFFTEGTELFSKGNLFYSRRIGGQPLHYWEVQGNLASNEHIVSNPAAPKLINATKISGRTASGLGIGVLNAVSNTQYATIEDSNGKIRTEETSPLTNYSIIVIDQTLKNNSSVSLINTNTLRAGKDYDANVTAGIWDLYDKKNKWNFFGQAGVSQLLGILPDGGNQIGYSHSLGFAKPSGNFNFNIYQNLTDHKYSQNDLGYATNNNFLDHGAWIGYKWLKPTKWYNRLNLNFNLNYSRRYLPSSYQMFEVNSNINGQFKNLWNGGMYVSYTAAQNDFYEPRIEGRIFKIPAKHVVFAWINSNEAKKYSAGLEFGYIATPKFGSRAVEVNTNHNYRFNQNLTISTISNIQLRYNNVGFATIDAGNTIIGSRTRYSVENVWVVKYNFNNKMGVNLRTRHYWSRVNNNQFYNLQQDGGLLATVKDYSSVANYNINFFNVDMVYTWQFALGSFLNIGWKNAIENFDPTIERDYFKNLKSTLSTDQLNNFSVKVIYFLDCAKLKKKPTV